MVLTECDLTIDHFLKILNKPGPVPTISEHEMVFFLTKYHSWKIESLRQFLFPQTEVSFGQFHNLHSRKSLK